MTISLTENTTLQDSCKRRCDLQSLWINKQLASPAFIKKSTETLINEYRSIYRKYLTTHQSSRENLKQGVAIILGSSAKLLSLGYADKKYLAIPTNNSSELPKECSGISARWLRSARDFLLEIDFLREAIKAYYSSSLKHGYVAKYVPTADMINHLERTNCLLVQFPKQTVFKFNDVPYYSKINVFSDNHEMASTEPSKDLIKDYRELLNRSTVKLGPLSYEALSSMFNYYANNLRLHANGKTLYRTYSQTKDRGGRFQLYPIQSLRKQARQYLTIDGAKTVELDYRSMHLFLTYKEAGLSLPAMDPYGLFEEDDIPRDEVKDVFTRAMGESSNQLYDAHLNHFLTNNAGASRRDTKRVLDRLLEAHPHLQDYLFKGFASFFQYKESEIASQVLTELTGQGILALPVHESFIVKAKHEAALREVMEHAFPGCPIH